jgi:hypothetical protein
MKNINAIREDPKRTNEIFPRRSDSFRGHTVHHRRLVPGKTTCSKKHINLCGDWIDRGPERMKTREQTYMELMVENDGESIKEPHHKFDLKRSKC